MRATTEEVKQDVLVRRREQLDKLKDVLDQVLELKDHFGQLPKAVSRSQLKGTCCSCGQVFMVVSKMGSLVCPHCMNPEVEWEWGALQVLFVPERDEQCEGQTVMLHSAINEFPEADDE